MNFVKLLQQLEHSLPTLKSGAYRMMPSSFDPQDPTLRGFPISKDWKWSSCASALQDFSATGVMMRIPLYWQLETPLFNACKDIGAFIFVSDPENIPLAAEALRIAEIDTVVTTAHDALKLSQHLADTSSLQPQSWIIVYPAVLPGLSEGPIRGAQISREIHILPGIPILIQCAVLRETHPDRFHIVEGIEWHHETNSISTKDAQVVPLATFHLPFQLTECGVCPCGQQMIRRA